MNTNKSKSVLDKFKLEYEEMAANKVKKAKSSQAFINKTDSSKKKATEPVKPSTKDKILVKFKHIKASFSSVVNKVKNPRKKAKKTTKVSQQLAKNQRNRGIMGIGLLLVVVSIIYSTYVIFIGVSSTASKVALLPQAFFALLILFKAFSKIYK